MSYPFGITEIDGTTEDEKFALPPRKRPEIEVEWNNNNNNNNKNNNINNIINDNSKRVL